MINNLEKKLTISNKKSAENGFVFVALLPVIFIIFVLLRDFRGISAAYAFNIGLNLMSCAICVIVYQSCKRDSAGIGENNGLFLSLLITTSISVFLAGTTWIMNGVSRLVFLNRLFNVLLFTDNFMLVVLFWRFECITLHVDEAIVHPVNRYLDIFLLPILICFTANLFFPIFFKVDEAGMYHRARFYPLSFISFLPVMLGIAAGIFKSKAKKKDKFIISSFVGFPLVIMIITLLKFHISFLEPTMFFSITIIYHMLIAVRSEKLAITQTELNVAAEIQESMLPHVFPPFPERHEFELYASMDPAREVGGDFYDFLMIDDNHLAILIADVSDKGVPASLFMMSTKNLINYRARQGGTPAEILADVNAHISSENESNMFVTVWMGILDLSTGILTCTNAGHEYPAICGEDGVFRIFRDKHGLMIGAMPKAKYQNYEMTMTPGSKIFVYTDGVPEANNPKEELYGLNRLETALNHTADKSPKDILDAIQADVDTFVNGAKQFDDLTMLCLEYKGAE